MVQFILSQNKPWNVGDKGWPHIPQGPRTGGLSTDNCILKMKLYIQILETEIDRWIYRYIEQCNLDI